MANQRPAFTVLTNDMRVFQAVAEEGVTLTTVLTTHHHWDHAGGNKDLVTRMPGLAVIAGDERIDGTTR